MRASKILALTACLLMIAAAAFAGKSGTLTIDVKPNVLPDSKTANLWIPYPLSNPAQDISNMKVTGNFDSSGVYRDPVSKAVFLYAGWSKIKGQPELSMSFHAAVTSREITEIRDSGEPVPAPIKARYLASDQWVPADAFVNKAQEIVKGKTGMLEKARAIYDWTVENTFRDPDVKGCGLAVPGRTLTECKGGGKCADISAVFVTLARAAGIPARDVYGLRLADPKSGDVTSAYHCWAEFYLPGTGWVPVDPADVRKMMLVNKLELDNSATGAWRKYFWGGDDLYRVTLNKDSRGVTFTPAQKGEPVNYFMYPFAQVDDATLNYFDPKAFSYTVTFTAD